MKIAPMLLQDRLNVPRFVQKQRLWCGPAALQSMLTFYNCLVTQEEISQFLSMDGGCFIQELGLFALSKNFDVKISSYDMLYVDPTWSSLDSNDLINKIRNRLAYSKSTEYAKTSYRSLVKYMSHGGELSIKLPTKDDIISELHSGRPILALVNSNALYERARLDSSGSPNDIAGTAGGHFIILVGHKNGYFYVVDPSYDNPVSFVQEDRFLFSLALWGGWTMVLNEKNS